MAKRNLLMDGLITGLAGAAATTAAIAAFGQVKQGSPWTPFNAISHMLFGNKVVNIDGFAPKETLSGLGVNIGALGIWGGLYEKLAGTVPFPQSLATGALASAAIWLFDYKIAPERMRPGFEKRLGPESIAAVYVILALILGLSPLWKKDTSNSTN